MQEARGQKSNVVYTCAKHDISLGQKLDRHCCFGETFLRKKRWISYNQVEMTRHVSRHVQRKLVVILYKIRTEYLETSVILEQRDCNQTTVVDNLRRTIQ